jgi:choline dehydrogenase-like flavoprotein
MVTLASPHSSRPDLHIFAAGPFGTDSRAAAGGAVLGVGFALVKPDSRGTVRLASPDPDAPPRIDPAHLRDPQDRKRMLFALPTPGHQDLDGAVVTLTEQGENTI